MAASATFALNAELCVRRARLGIVTPDLRHSRRLQAEAPLIDLSEFGQPALSTSAVRLCSEQICPFQCRHCCSARDEESRWRIKPGRCRLAAYSPMAAF